MNANFWRHLNWWCLEFQKSSKEEKLVARSKHVNSSCTCELCVFVRWRRICEICKRVEWSGDAGDTGVAGDDDDDDGDDVKQRAQVVVVRT